MCSLRTSSLHLKLTILHEHQRCLKAQLCWRELFSRLGLSYTREASPVCKTFLVRAEAWCWNNGTIGRCLLQRLEETDSSSVEKLLLPTFSCLQPLGHPSFPCEAPCEAFRQNPAWKPAEILIYFNGLLSECKFDSSVSSHFLPGVTPLTSFCSGNLPLFGSSYVKSYNLSSRNWDFCCLFVFLGKDVVLESAQQILIDRQSIFGNDLISLPEISSLYVPSENMASYLSSTGVPGDMPLNLSSSTDNNQWFSLQETSSPSHPSKHPQVWM